MGAIAGHELPLVGDAGAGQVDRLVVEGEDVVLDGALVRAAEDEIARAHRAQAQRFAE